PFVELVAPEINEANMQWRVVLDGVRRSARLSHLPSLSFDSRTGERRLLDVFRVASSDAFGGFSRADFAALGGLLGYIELTQVGRMPALRPPKRAEIGAHMLIDATT